MRNQEPRGCLALLFGFGVRGRNLDIEARKRKGIPEEMDENMEGDIHAGPGGYEGMGYAGGYAAEYRDRDSKVGVSPSQSLDANSSDDDLEFEEFSDEGDA